MQRIVLFPLFGLLIWFPALPAAPATTAPRPKVVLSRVFSSSKIESEWFTQSFLKVVPPARLFAVRKGLEATLGAFRKVRGSANPYTLIFTRGTARANIALDIHGRIRGLRVFQIAPTASSLTDIIHRVRRLAGTSSLLVLENGRSLVAYHADTPLAVGSASKLAVLAALQEQIKQGRHHWAEIVHLKRRWKALPSGILQNWPDGSALTLHTLATLMISISDNTAATALIRILGRRAVEAEAPAQDRPFLTPLEAFKLKLPDNKPLLIRYLAAAGKARRDLLEAVDALPRPTLGKMQQAFDQGPLALRVEWFFNVHQLCNLMRKVQHLPLMSVNPGGGLADPAAWKRIAFKGGSEPGVLNLTTWLVAKTGNRYCVSLTVNRSHHTVDDTRIELLYSSLLNQLAIRTETRH